MQSDHSRHAFSSAYIRKDAQDPSITINSMSSLPSPWSSPTCVRSSVPNSNVPIDIAMPPTPSDKFGHLRWTAPTPEYSPELPSNLSPTEHSQHSASFSSPGLLDNLPYENYESQRQQEHANRMKQYLESESIRQIQEPSTKHRQREEEAPALKDESDALPNVIDYTGALNDPTWPPPDPSGPPKPTFRDFQLIDVDEVSTTRDIQELFGGASFGFGRASSAIDDVEPSYATSGTLTVGSGTLDFGDAMPSTYARHSPTSIPVESVQRDVTTRPMVRYPSDSGLGISIGSAGSYQASPYSIPEGLTEGYGKLNSFPPLLDAAETASHIKSRHRPSSSVDGSTEGDYHSSEIPYQPVPVETDMAIFTNATALTSASTSASNFAPPQTVPSISHEGAQKIQKYILQPMLAAPDLQEFGSLLQQASQRLISQGPDRLSCLRDLEKFLLVEHDHMGSTANAYLCLCRTFLKRVSQTVIQLRLVPEKDLCRQSDAAYSKGYLQNLHQRVQGHARWISNKQHELARVSQKVEGTGSRGVMKGGSAVQNQVSALPLPPTTDSNKRRAPVQPDGTSYSAKKPKIDAPGSELPTPEHSAAASAKHLDSMALATPAQQPQQQSPFDRKFLHPSQGSIIESNGQPPSAKTTFVFDAKNGTAIHEKLFRQTNEYRSSKAYTPEVPADGARPRMGFVPAPEPRIQKSNLPSPVSHHLGRKVGKASLKAHQCDKCPKKFARACDLRKHGKTHDRPHKCSVATCKYAKLGFSAEKDRDRHWQDKHNKNSIKHACKYQPCDYSSTRESNVKQHMEKTHGYKYERTKTVNTRRQNEKATTAPAAPLAPTSVPTQLATPETYLSTSPSDFAVEPQDSPAVSMSDNTSGVCSHEPSPSTQFDMDDTEGESAGGISRFFFPPLNTHPVSFLTPSLIHDRTSQELSGPIDSPDIGYQTVQQATNRISSQSPTVASTDPMGFGGLKQQANPNMALGDPYNLSSSPGERVPGLGFAEAEALLRDAPMKITNSFQDGPPPGVPVENVDFDHDMDRRVFRQSRKSRVH